jgi:hypothetical protein
LSKLTLATNNLSRSHCTFCLKAKRRNDQLAA